VFGLIWLFFCLCFELTDYWKMNNQMLEKWLSGFNFYRRRVNI
jgi:vacuolar-type H+-ATPase subunit I/STV1